MADLLVEPGDGMSHSSSRQQPLPVILGAELSLSHLSEFSGPPQQRRRRYFHCDTIIYTLTFANVGNQAANGVVITEPTHTSA